MTDIHKTWEKYVAGLGEKDIQALFDARKPQFALAVKTFDALVVFLLHIYHNLK